MDTPTSQLTPRDTTYHCVYLFLSIGVLILAGILRVREEGLVVLPVLDLALPETCYFKRLFGLGCPGCGLTRCFISLAHGDFVRAWRFNPGGFLFFALVAAQIPYRLGQIRRIRRQLHQWRPVTLSTVLSCILVVALLAQWIWRLID